MKYFLILLALIIITFSFSSPALAQEQTREIKVFIDDLPVSFDVQPVIESGRTLVPFRAIAEALNINVNWNGSTQTVEAFDGKTLIKLQIGIHNAFRNEVAVPLDVPPLIIDGRTLIPLRFFSEAFNCDVSWNSDTYRVEITSGPKEMTVIGFYALGDTGTSSWTNLFRNAYPETGPGNTDVVDELALGWYSFDEQGNLLTRSWTGWQRPAGWENVLNAAQEYSLKTEMTIYNTDRYGTLSSLLSSETASAQLVEAIMKEVALYGGVNLNFEEFGLAKSGEELTAVRQQLTDFVRLLSVQLKIANKSLTLTIHPPNSSYKGYDYRALGELADRIIIMAYDYGPKPEPLNFVVQAVEMAKEVVPPQKLVLGICAPYENPESMAAKIGIAKRHNLHGIAIWRLGLVTHEMWQVLRSNVL
ncbi:MAG: stalk domain-containing protein [Bacillota bacterium]|nr:stalk domain-containing protein [Bacillota bacterium]